MSPAIPQFRWRDRDSAARDILQLVYHAPPFISRLAAGLLHAFHSSAIVPELRALVLDEEVEYWTRIYALRAISSAQGDILAMEFQPLAQAAIQQRHEQMMLEAEGEVCIRRAPIVELGELAEFVDAHPSNHEWFFALIDLADPRVQERFLSSELYHQHSEGFRVQLVQRLLKLLDDHPALVDLGVVNELLGHGVTARKWLEAHFDRVLELSLSEPDNRRLKYIARHWERLNDALRERITGWDAALPPRPPQPPQVEYRNSPAFVTLQALFERAGGGDRDAFTRLTDIARRRQGSVPMRAVATHFIGELRSTYDVVPLLSRLLLYRIVHWDEQEFDSPVRFEAGEALLYLPTAETWETFVDGYFIQPRDDFLRIQNEWIAYLTDVLSGTATTYQNAHYPEPERRPWFRALREVSDEELAQMMK
ncbi:MAG: hypothetical protein IPK19_01110 [Chloroflexi bacterium]|nr:hypothetical protein [Chloroflexota bacterium]